MAKREKVPRALRDRLLVDAMHRCCLCPEHPDVTDLHHVVPISEGGPDTEENLMVICPTCHAKITRLRSRYTVEQLRMYKERWVTLCGSGLPLDVRLAQASDHTRPPLPPEILLPPEPYFAHPYALQANFTGRVRWRKALTAWLGDAGAPPVYVMEAIGGMGKSAATWFWVQRDVLGRRLTAVGTERADEAACRVRKNHRPDGVMWWSFYDSQASFASFVADALVYCSGGRVDPQAIPSPHDRVVRLLGLLQRRRVLLVLDGLERALRAYAGLGGAYQGDDVTEDQKQRHRACVDPYAGAFLRAAASPSL
ncbi:MAG TPA: HNH endonuclease signature motif containing protein, partial [Phycisphaerae bacterium]|nr:HNH endonuclease signature motif containing protein [Phycisphaerae bacterium]